MSYSEEKNIALNQKHKNFERLRGDLDSDSSQEEPEIISQAHNES